MMTSMTQPDGMDRRIFETGLPVEAVSLYLLCCNIVRGDTPITMETIRNLWNSTETALENGLALLIKHTVLEPAEDDKGQAVYQLRKAEHWQF